MSSKYFIPADSELSSESFFKKIVAASPNLIFLFNPVRNIFIYISERMESILGYTGYDLKEMGSKALEQILYPDDLINYTTNILPKINKAKNKEVINFAFRFFNKKRKILWLNVNVVVVSRKIDGTPIQVLGIANDATSEKNLNIEIKKSELYYRTLISNLHEDIFIINKDYTITDVNSHVLVSSQKKKENLIGTHCFAVSHSNDRPCNLYGEECHLQQVFETGKPAHFKHFPKNVGSNPVYADIMMSAIKDENGNVKSVIATVRNVTTLKNYKDKLIESETRYYSLFDDALNMIHIVDRNGIIIDVNKAEQERLGYTKEEMIGKHITKFIAHNHIDSVKLKIKEIIERKTSCVYNTKLVTKTGNYIIVEADVTPQIINGEVVTLRAISNDITSQEHAKKIVLQNLLLNSVNNILKKTLECETETDIANECLKEAEQLTNSKFGFIGELNNNNNVDIISITNIVRNEEILEKSKSAKKLLNLSINGIWKKVITNRKSYFFNLFNNSKKNVDVIPGYSSIDSFLGVPLFHDKKLIGLIVLANKPDGYREIDKSNIEALSTTISTALFNKRLSVELDNYKQHLEKIVRERTNELKETNKNLGNEIELRKKIETSLKISEKRYKKIFENAPIGMYRSNSKGEILLANSFLLNLLGYKSVKDFALNVNASELYSDKKYRIYFSEIIETEGVIHNFEAELIRKDGKKISVIEDATAIFDETKDIVYYEGIIQDVTQRKKNLETIRILSEAIRQNPTFVLITDPEGNIEYVNPHFEKVTGYSYAEVIGTNPRILKSGELEKNYYAKLWKHIKSGQSWECEFHNKKKNGELFWTNAKIFPILNDKGETINFVAVEEDITEKKILIKELVIAKEAAEKSDKLKSEFLAQISHEIRTPLSSLISFSSLLEDEFGEQIDDDLNYAFDAIKKSGKRITRTVDLILNMSELATDAYDYYAQEIELNKNVIENIYLENKHFAESKNINFIFEKRIESFFVIVDKYSLTQIISNIVDNAIKFTNEGTIEILEYLNNENIPIIEIRDTGIGISKDYLPKIFDKFSQEEQGYTRKYDGNGLGLSLVKEYCILNNINIEVESKKDAGSTFRLIFPDAIKRRK